MGVLFGLHEDVENFAIHMFCGIIIVHFFTETFNAGTRSIVRNKALVQKMAMPREMFPVASMLVSGYHVVPAAGDPGDRLPAARLDADAGRPGRRWSLALIIIALLGTALALLFSAANVFFRDVGNVASILTNFVRFGVPMIYPYTMVAGPLRRVRAVLPAQPDRRRGAAVPAGVLGRHDRATRPRRRPSTSPTTCGRSPASRVVRRHRHARDRPARLHPAREQDPGAPLMSGTESIVVDHATKNFTLRYHRTFKQMTVAALRAPGHQRHLQRRRRRLLHRSSRASRSA